MGLAWEIMRYRREGNLGTLTLWNYLNFLWIPLPSQNPPVSSFVWAGSILGPSFAPSNFQPSPISSPSRRRHLCSPSPKTVSPPSPNPNFAAMADRGAGGERGGERGSLPWVRRPKRRTRNKYVPVKGPGLSKASVVVGDGNGHVGLGVKCSKEVATAKIVGYSCEERVWGNKIGKPHTVPCKVTGKCGSVTVRTVPAPCGAGIVAARVPKKVLQFAGIEDVFTLLLPEGLLRLLATLSSSWMYFVMQATFDYLLKTYGFLTPDFWTETRFIKSPFQEFTDLLAKPTKALVLEDVED
ncbi:hypothetical protein DKX38_024745 [Salix brachista]|uniref:Small ribosomal subunit protein uS5 n=1 Tax=Salix brachista TaxID=2182728 RepID=A0A5N5JP01_9ROSI|nr:hypothetical protein DKX38_024745 [Salix brachista]